MKRLTEECWRNLDPWECCGQDRYCMRGRDDIGGCTGGCIVPKLYARLAAYEDTGLEPEEISKLMSAETNGGPTLSLHVGDTIYLLVTRRKYLQTNLHSTYIKEVKIRLDNLHKYVDKVGKTVFLTREAAEAVLADQKENDQLPELSEEGTL